MTFLSKKTYSLLQYGEKKKQNPQKNNLPTNLKPEEKLKKLFMKVTQRQTVTFLQQQYFIVNKSLSFLKQEFKMEKMTNLHHGSKTD